MLRFADLATDQWLVEAARNLAQALLRNETGLPPAENAAIVQAHLARWLGSREAYLGA